ncbi:hypothetical protein AVEN_223148-1 [Araneus ventricosus]|uniref:Uncharacterized protein n=1 Tax=Araneus ventricosus TaxID=182803 RepID=A0A4Y2WT16_ARAVE|nr:hypothetical protein AVEN_223148-1 [Araneus ventricosus]
MCVIILQVALLLAALAAVDATVWTPGLLNAGIVGPAAVSTGSVVAIPGAVTTDKRVIGTTGLIAGAPLLNSGIIGNGLLANGLIGAPVLNSGLIGAPLLNSGIISPIGAPVLNSGIVSPIGAPLLNSGIVSPIGLKSAGILAAPGVVKSIL